MVVDDALGWAIDVLTGMGREVVLAPEEVKDRPWSRVVRLTTDGGAFWLKVNRGGTTYEPALVEFLARLAPDAVAAPLAVAGAWSLQADGGDTLRARRGAAPPTLEAMSGFMRAAATLQRTTAPHVAELIALGVPDLRPERVPAAFDALLDDTAWLRVGQEGGLRADTYARLVEHRPVVAEASARLSSGPVPPALQHDDLHDNNVFVGSGGTTYRIFDWGDASVAHPFATLLVSLRSLTSQLGVPADDPALLAMRDAYLECWSDLASLDELGEEARLAVALAPIGRALSWQRALADATPADRTEWQEYVPGWLEDLLL